MKRINNETTLEKFLGFDFKAKVKVAYDGMQNQTYNVHEIVGTRVTIRTNRLIDFNINEVELYPIGYSQKEQALIRQTFHAN
jgi:hypothetical protein